MSGMKIKKRSQVSGDGGKIMEPGFVAEIRCLFWSSDFLFSLSLLELCHSVTSGKCLSDFW